MVTRAKRPATKAGKPSPATKKPGSAPVEAPRHRNFPSHTLEAALVLAQKIQDEMAGKPMNRLLLADALGLSPSSSNFRVLLSSANKYGLTEGNEKSDAISLSDVGADATQTHDQTRRLRAVRAAAVSPPVFGAFFRDYANKKLPSPDMLPKILSSQYKVPQEVAQECAEVISGNGRQVELIRDIGGSPHILLDAETVAASSTVDSAPDTSTAVELNSEAGVAELPAQAADSASRTRLGGLAGAASTTQVPRPIFVGHGKNKAPLQQLQRLLTSFQIPHKIVVDEANLGRPISQKVKETIEECGSAILIFTRDEKFHDAEGNEVWRPSENVVHELGATSFAYGDRIVIFKERGLHFPTNFQSIGYIEFEADDITARTADLLKELIGFGLVRVTPT
jgi:predicted nucleotide-binding protein